MQKLGEATSSAVVIGHVGVNSQLNADGTKTPIFGLLAASPGAEGQPVSMVSLPSEVKAKVAILGVCYGDFAAKSSGTKFDGAYAIGTNHIDTKLALMAWDQVKGMSGTPGQIVTAFKQTYDSYNSRRMESPGAKSFAPLDGTFVIGGF